MPFTWRGEEAILEIATEPPPPADSGPSKEAAPWGWGLEDNPEVG